MVGPIFDFPSSKFYEEGQKKGFQQGRDEILAAMARLVKEGKLSDTDAASSVNMSVDEFMKASEALTSQ